MMSPGRGIRKTSSQPHAPLRMRERVLLRRDILSAIGVYAVVVGGAWVMMFILYWVTRIFLLFQ